MQSIFPPALCAPLYAGGYGADTVKLLLTAGAGP